MFDNQGGDKEKKTGLLSDNLINTNEDSTNKRAKAHGAKQSLDLKSGFGRRQNQAIQIRKSKREGALEKKRRAGEVGDDYVGGSGDFNNINSEINVDDNSSGNWKSGNGDNKELPQLEDPTNPWCYTYDYPASAVPVALLPTIVQFVQNESDPKAVYQGMFLIRKILAVDKEAPVQLVIDSGVVPQMVKVLRETEDLATQFEASWALSNIASGAREHTKYITELNVVPIWISHLQSPSKDCREQAAWALGNIAGDGAACRDYVLDLGVLPPLLNLITTAGTESVSMLQNAVWALSNLCRFKPSPNIKLMEMALPVVCSLLIHPDSEVALDAAWTLSYMSDGNDRIQMVLDAGAVPTIIEMASLPDKRFMMPAIRTIGNICAGLDRQTQVVLNAGALRVMPMLLDKSTPRGVRKEAAWSLSNIAAGTKEQIQEIINAGLIPLLIETMGAYELEVKKEAIWTIANAVTNGTSEQIAYIVQCNAIEALCSVLSTIYDPNVVIVSLEALQVFLENGEGIRQMKKEESNEYAARVTAVEGDVTLETLQSHNNENVRNLAGELLSTHFDVTIANDGEFDNNEEIFPTEGQNEAGIPINANTALNGGQSAAFGVFDEKNNFNCNFNNNSGNPFGGDLGQNFFNTGNAAGAGGFSAGENQIGFNNNNISTNPADIQQQQQQQQQNQFQGNFNQGNFNF